MKSILVSVLFLFFLFFNVNASYFRSYQVEDGLAHNSVWAVMQDSRGFMWFGTNDGLNRFDGVNFKTYRKQQNDPYSLGNNFIHCLIEDSNGRFLIGTKSGLYLYNRDKENFSHIIIDKKKEISVNSIIEDPDGKIWVATNGQGFYELDSDLSVKAHYSSNNSKNGLKNNFIWSIAKDNTGTIWLGTVGGGLVSFNSKSNLFINYKDIPQIDIKDTKIFSIYCDIDNNIWIGTSTSGLCRYNPQTGKIVYYLQDNVLNIRSITEYSSDELIMGSERGLIKFNRINESFEFLNNTSSFDNLTDNSIFAVARDREGSFWIGTYFGGVNYYSPEINKFHYHYYSTKQQSRNIISGFAEDNEGKIWIGTFNDGLLLFNPKKDKFEPTKLENKYSNIQSLLFEKDKLYIGQYSKGVNILNTRTGQISPMLGNLAESNSFVNVIRKNSKGDILFNSEVGVNYYDQAKNKIETFPALNRKEVKDIKDIKEDYNGTLWFGTHAGLYRLLSNGKWEGFTNNPNNPKSLVNDNVNCVYQDTKFRIWVGTEGGGLTLFNSRTNSFERVYDTESGFPSNMIYSILDDADGNIWVGTGGGLVRIKSDLSSFKTYGYIQDLFKIRFNLNCALRASNQVLYFGGTNGFISFNPKQITDNQKKPLIEITGFKVNNKEVTPETKSSPLKFSISNTKEITLKHNQSSFSFEFEALSFLSPGNNRYAYMLEGFDKDWNYISDNRAFYTNIPAGHYQFVVKGANNDGTWSDIKSVEIIIKAPFMLSNLMLFVYLILTIFILFKILSWRNKRNNARNQEQIFKYKTAKEKELYESKINFFTNIAHEIRTPLSLIIAPLERILHSNDLSVKSKDNLDVISRNANRLLELVNQLLDFRKIEDDMFLFNFKNQNIVRIIQKVYSQYEKNAELNNIELLMEIEQDDLICKVDSEAIYKILSNLISNAIKFTRNKIEIRLETINDTLIISVIDNGVGLEKDYLEKIFEPFFQIRDKNNVSITGSGLGLSLSQSLAKKHGGEISVSSEYGKGCTFTLKLPLVRSESIIYEELPIESKVPVSTVLTQDLSLKILIVEDNTELRIFLKDNIGENYHIYVAENGVKALSIVEAENIDLIVSDIVMPEMDGIELCNTLKSNIAYSHIPIILLSAKTDTATKIDGLVHGAEAYLEKPFSVEQLKAQINSIIENRNNIRNNFIQSPLSYFKQNTTNTVNSDFIEKLNNIIIENMSDEGFSIENISEQFFMSRSNFHKKIKSVTGITPNDYIKIIRLNKSAQMLSTGKYKINEVCYLVGFNTPSYFSKCFYEQFGKLPKDFIQSAEQ